MIEINKPLIRRLVSIKSANQRLIFKYPKGTELSKATSSVPCLPQAGLFIIRYSSFL